MSEPITYEGLLKFILLLSGIGVLVFLMLLIRNFVKITGNINKLFEENQNELDKTLKSLPVLTKNLQDISDHANVIVSQIEPDVSKITSNVADITTKFGAVSSAVESTALKAADTIDVVSGSISDTAYAFSSNVNSIDKYIAIVLEVLDQIKVFLKR